MAGATPLMPVTGYLYNSSYVSMGWPDGRSVQRSNCPSGLTPRNRPSSVRLAVISLVRWRRRSAADDHWRTMNYSSIGRYAVVGCKLRYYANEDLTLSVVISFSCDFQLSL